LYLGVLRLAGHEDGDSIVKRSPRLALGSFQASRQKWTPAVSADSGEKQLISRNSQRQALGIYGIEGSNMSWQINLTIPRASLGDFDS
jgi:hypothetical protein